MHDDLYCKVYVSGARDTELLKTAVSSVVGATVEVSEVRTPVLTVRVGAESRHLPTTHVGDDFVKWPHYLEIDAADERVGLDAFVAAIAQLVSGLRARGLRTVAACEFEDELEAALRGAGR